MLGRGTRPAQKRQRRQTGDGGHADQKARVRPRRLGDHREDDEELKKWPPYTGKPVSDVQDAWRYAAPVVSQAEKLTISALGLAGTGLTKLAGFLEQRRRDRDSSGDKNRA